jgi:hypothetical protein
MKDEGVQFGAWLSPVERCVRDAEVPGSNPGAPTGRSIRNDRPFLHPGAGDLQPREVPGSSHADACSMSRRACAATANPGAPTGRSIRNDRPFLHPGAGDRSLVLRASLVGDLGNFDLGGDGVDGWLADSAKLGLHGASDVEQAKGIGPVLPAYLADP